MEQLRGPINSCFFGEKMSSHHECSGEMGMEHPQMSFLQMLNRAAAAAAAVEDDDDDEMRMRLQIHQHYTMPESNLQLLLKMQSRSVKPEPDSCVTHAVEAAPAAVKKRKRPRVKSLTASAKSPQEVESQRMNHIAVERNRRRLMNCHLGDLRSLMPASYVQRSDQASIIGGAIEFVKELEQLLHSLQAKKRMRVGGDATSSSASSSCTNAYEDEAAPLPAEDFFVSPQYTGYTQRGAAQGEGVDIEATLVQGHVNLKILGRRRHGQMVRALAAMEEVGLSVLHLNITSLDACSVLYSLNLKMEECKFGSADEIATAVHQIFCYVASCRD